MLHSRDETALTLAQPDRAIPRMDRQRLAAAIHLAVDLRVAEGSFHRHGYPQADMAIARIGLHLAIEFMRLNWAVSCPQAYITFEVLNGNAAITGVQINRAAQRIGLHRAIAGMHVYRPADGFSLYGTVAGFHL